MAAATEIAPDVIAPELVTTESLKVAYSGPIFAAPATDIMQYVFDTGRGNKPPSSSAVKYNYWMYEMAEFSRMEGEKPQVLDTDQFRGIIGLQRWVGNGPDRQFARSVLPENRLEYLIMMARRDLLTNEVSNIMGTALSFIQMHEDNIEAAYQTLQSAADDDFAKEMHTNAERWGFNDAYDLVSFVGDFDRFSQTRMYEFLDVRIRRAMPKSSLDDKVGNATLESFRKSESRKSLFTYFYLNRLYPEDSSQRSVAFHRLGIPPHVKINQLENEEGWRRVSTTDVGAFFTYFNAPLIRFGFFGDWLERPEA